MTRRKLLALLAALPLVGRLAPKPKPVMQHVLTPERVFPPAEHIYTFLIKRDGTKELIGYRRVEYMSRQQLEKEYPSDPT